MNATSNADKHADKKALVITRVFNAPRKLVWEAWTQPDHIVNWWGPKGFGARVDKLEFHIGGQASIVMIGPDGTEYPSESEFREIVPLERIVATDDFGDEFIATSKVELPKGLVTTTIFEDLGDQNDDGDKTRVTVRIMHPSMEDKRKHEDMGVVPGWNSMLDCLVEYLETLG